MQTYDYIVVGAGSAGAVVANRLSTDPRNTVLLLEAGRASHPWSPIPIGMARLIANPAANWLYSSEPEASTNGRRLPVPRGKLLGGSSSINGMVFVRGQAQDFDTWWRYPSADDPSPRPSLYPFHELPNVIMTPHCSPRTDGTIERRSRDVARNIDRFVRSEPLENVVATT